MDTLSLGMLTVCRRLRRLKHRLPSQPGIYPARRKERTGPEHTGLLSAAASGGRGFLFSRPRFIFLP